MIIGLDTFGKPVETADLYVKTTCFRIFFFFILLRITKNVLSFSIDCSVNDSKSY